MGHGSTQAQASTKLWMYQRDVFGIVLAKMRVTGWHPSEQCPPPANEVLRCAWQRIPPMVAFSPSQAPYLGLGQAVKRSRRLADPRLGRAPHAFACVPRRRICLPAGRPARSTANRNGGRVDSGAVHHEPAFARCRSHPHRRPSFPAAERPIDRQQTQFLD